jgi:hypothetical protein
MMGDLGLMTSGGRLGSVNQWISGSEREAWIETQEESASGVWEVSRELSGRGNGRGALDPADTGT